MAVYQLLEPGRVFFDLTGQVIAAFGSVTFYEPGTTTEADTWSDYELTTLNPNPVELDSSGRMETPAWGEDPYDVVLKDADGATVWTEEVRPQIQPGSTIPALEEGEFLGNDGTNLLWQPILQVPDPTDSEGYFLTVAGGIATWTPPVEPETFAIVIDGNSMTVEGTGGDRLEICGTATGVNAGGRTQTVNVTFPATFSNTPFVAVQLTNTGNLSTAGNNPSSRISSISGTGFTVIWTMGELDDTQSQYDFNAAVTFGYHAIGTYTPA